MKNYNCIYQIAPFLPNDTSHGSGCCEDGTQHSRFRLLQLNRGYAPADFDAIYNIMAKPRDNLN